MKKKAKWLALFLTIVLALSFVACSSKNGSKSDNSRNTGVTPADKKNPVTLTTVSMFGGTDPNAPNYQAIISQFMKDYSYITIEDDSQVSDQDWKTRIAADFAVGNEPDVIQYFIDANASDVLAADKFVTIDEIRAEYPDYAKDTLDSALKAAANPDGIERAVPTTGYWEGLYCNKDLFKKYGLELPTTWDNLLQAIATFKENNIIPIAVSLNNVPHYWVEALILSAAGSEGYTQVPETVPQDWCTGLAMIKTLRDMEAFPKDTDTIDNDFAGELFKSKRAAMKLDGSWFLSSIPDKQNTVITAVPVMPGGKAKEGEIIGGISSGFYITKKAWEDPDKRDAAVKFVMANTNKEGVTKYWNGSGQAAVSADPIKDMTPLAISGFEYSNKASVTLLPIDSRISQEAYNTLIAGIVDISTGAKTPEDLLKEVLDINAKQ
ncbi:ABC transporter substrate-binding protein [Anaerocolumna xylanovorans]|uniref:Raffinose/stachyose/melibiose transport system substrate-binding protein n=1 Tax=Anaerocolumna xylanovorans DSM 12503 TaxID=1121345 RepID=A0A1M7YGQ9_9FIRM|nr:extracellular solute-binding protein [Anaerocolumna xylanovorans]SHO51783.1 raffinose/stachyose/melibiose transport system substrate-binding protein [Anaerocolumna xylanovorans DSM 12503]